MQSAVQPHQARHAWRLARRMPVRYTRRARACHGHACVPMPGSRAPCAFSLTRMAGEAGKAAPCAVKTAGCTSHAAWRTRSCRACGGRGSLLLAALALALLLLLGLLCRLGGALDGLRLGRLGGLLVLLLSAHDGGAAGGVGRRRRGVGGPSGAASTALPSDNATRLCCTSCTTHAGAGHDRERPGPGTAGGCRPAPAAPIRPLRAQTLAFQEHEGFYMPGKAPERAVRGWGRSPGSRRCLRGLGELMGRRSRASDSLIWP